MNIIIVESENDEYFINALAKIINREFNICKIDKFQHSSLSEQGVMKELFDALYDAKDRDVKKIGIILDQDDSNSKDRIALINRSLTEALMYCAYQQPSELLTVERNFLTIKIDELTQVKIACYFINVDGQGELEDVLKSIKTKESVFADSLDAWIKCLESKGKKIAKKGERGDISEKEILKLWVDFYKRFDTLKKGDRKQADKNTDWKGMMLGTTTKGDTVKARGIEIFDLNSDKLNDLRSFLEMFD